MDMEMITDLMEAVMILCFGLSWPISIRKSWVSRTAKGKSLFFECFIWIGYVFGIARKFMQLGMGVETSWLFYLAWFFYFLNIAEITIDIILYFRNLHFHETVLFSTTFSDFCRIFRMESERAQKNCRRNTLILCSDSSLHCLCLFCVAFFI